MSISEMEATLEKNKHITLEIAAPFIGDPIRQGVTKPDAGFLKNVIGRIKNTVPGAASSGALERRYNIPREW